MNQTMRISEDGWDVFADGQFEEFDELAEAIGGWGVDFRQLGPGRSPADVIQFGSPDYLVTRFHIKRPCEQRGSTPPGMLTIGFRERGSGEVYTPEGAVIDDGLWCFSAGREFACTSRSNFLACGISLSESLLDEVADACELWAVRSSLGSNKIVRCRRQADLEELRARLAIMSLNIKGREAAPPCARRYRELELDLVRQLLETLADPSDVMRPAMSNRRQLVLRRTLDYLEAHPNSPITVHELAQSVGSGVRTLEYVFKDYFGITPKAHLTARRLAGARRELQRADRQSTRVSDIALRWGFWHLGRFAISYRRFFGELPSVTLEQSS